MPTSEERAKAFREFCYDRMIDDVDAEFLVVLAAEFEKSVLEEREACALIADNILSDKSAHPVEKCTAGLILCRIHARSEKASPERIEEG